MMAKANALRTLSQQIASVAGPSIGGVLIAVAGVHVAFWVNAATFLVAVSTVLTIGSYPPQGGGTRFGWNSISEGFAFLKGRPSIQGCFIADLNATVLGMPTALFPALALHHFHGGSTTLGLLYAAPGIGSTVGSLLSGWIANVRLPGRADVIAITIWGVGIVGFGLAPWLAVAVILLAVAGGADVISAIFRSTIIQTETPDRLRGRLSSIQLMVVTSGPRLGNAEGGLVAAATNAQFSVASGGLGCVVGIGIIARLLPQFLKYQLPTTHPDDLPVAEVEQGDQAGA
jgi:MFS family permease